MTEETWLRLGSPSGKSCCEKGDIFHAQFRVLNNGTKYGENTWRYEKDGVWKQGPPDTIHWVSTRRMEDPTSKHRTGALLLPRTRRAMINRSAHPPETPGTHTIDF
jgi:hypothetical protein